MAIILEILDHSWTRLALTKRVISYDIEEVLGSAETNASITIPLDDAAAQYVPHPDDEAPNEGRFRLWEEDNPDEVFAGIIDTTKRVLEHGDTLTFGGIIRGGELAFRNFGRRDMLGWPLDDVVTELLRDNIGRAPFAVVTATNEDPDAPAINAILGEPQRNIFWGITYDGSRPVNFATPEYITIDLGSERTVDAVRVVMECWSNRWYKWRLSTSPTGAVYTLRHDKSGTLPTTERGTLIELGGISIRFVRLEVYASSDGYPRVAGVLTYQNIATLGSDTTLAVPWVENDDSGNVATTGTVSRVVQDGSFAGDGILGNSFVTRLDAGAADITHTFRGTSNSVYVTQEDAASVDVYVDAVLAESDIQIPDESYNYKIFEVTGLSNGVHTLRVVRKTGKPQIDYFTGEYVTSYRRAEENDAIIAYKGVWNTTYNKSYSSHAEAQSNASGDEAVIYFTGDSFKLIGAKGTARGILEWFVDAVSQGTVDLYSATFDPQEELFSWTGTYGDHTLRIRNTGTKNASSTGIKVGVDRVEGNWVHSIYLRSADDTNLALIGRLTEMTNSFLRLNYDGTVDLLGAIGTDTGEIIREGENRGGNIITLSAEGDYTSTASAILAKGRGSDTLPLRVFIFDRTVRDRIGLKVAKLESRDISDAYLLVRQAQSMLNEIKFPKRQYSVSYDPANVGTIQIGDLIRLYAPRTGLSGDKYRVYRKTTQQKDGGKSITLEVANRRDPLSNLITRASRDLSLTTNTPQGFKNVTQYGGNAENFVAETGGSTFRSAEIDFYVDDEAIILDAKLRMKIGKYRTYERDTVSGGGSTTESGGGSTSGSSSISTSETNDGEHSHTWARWNSDTPMTGTVRRYESGDNTAGTGMNLETNAGSGNSLGTSTNGGIHDHGMAHTHTTPNHSHNTPNHTHTPDYDIFEEGALPGAVSVLFDGTNIDSLVGGPFTATTGDTTFDVSLTGVVTSPGWHTLRFEAASGKGRITPYVLVKSLQL